MRSVPFYKENYYALMIAIFTDWDTDKCLRYMKVSSLNCTDRRKCVKSNVKYKDYGEQCAILVICAGMSYRGAGKILNMDHYTVKKSIKYYKEKIKNGIVEN